MDLLRKEIQNISKIKPEIGLRYYDDLLNIIDNHHELKPDVSVETCKAIIEGICKLIVHLIEQEPLHALDKLELKELTRRTLNLLNEKVEIFDQDFIRSVINVVRIVGESRNKHGDISHGRAGLKEQVNDQDFSEMISMFTESIAIYLIRKLNKGIEHKNDYLSDQMQEYNSWLDREMENFPIESVSYSKALFDYDKDLYYKKYNEEFLITNEDNEFEISEKDSEIEIDLDEKEILKTIGKYYSDKESKRDILKFIIKHKLDATKFMPELENFFFTNERPSRQKLSDLFVDSMPKERLKAESEILEAAILQLRAKLTF